MAFTFHAFFYIVVANALFWGLVATIHLADTIVSILTIIVNGFWFAYDFVFSKGPISPEAHDELKQSQTSGEYDCPPARMKDLVVSFRSASEMKKIPDGYISDGANVRGIFYFENADRLTTVSRCAGHSNVLYKETVDFDENVPVLAKICRVMIREDGTEDESTKAFLCPHGSQPMFFRGEELIQHISICHPGFMPEPEEIARFMKSNGVLASTS